MPSSIGAALLGILSAVSWGGGDFCGGLAAKRSAPLGVVATGAASGLALVVLLALAVGEAAPPPAALGYAAGAGAAGAIGLAALYRGLAVGRMAIVAPVSAALSAALPVAWGVFTEGVPAAPRLAGFALALAGIWLVARAGDGRADGRGLALALLAGCGFGGFLVLMHAGARDGTWWPLAAARATTCALVLLAAVARRAPWAPAGPGLRLALLSGVLDAGGNALFVLAGKAGRLDVAAVLASMYPASTILLAALVLRERVTRPQAAGVAALFVAIVLVAA
jgi:drug/metabolite transporter (DMT)-like permease